MAKAPTLSDITNMLTAGTVINNNNDLIEAAFQNTLSRDGSTPNQMEADLDLNNYDLLNVKQINATDIKISGTAITDSVKASEEAAALSASNAADSATAASTSATEASLYDGPKVDTFAELASVTPAMMAVGEYIRVIELNEVYKREPEVVVSPDLDYSGSGGVKLKVITNGPYYVDQFGAPTDGVADARPAILAAVTAASNNGHFAVRFGKGIYAFGATIDLPAQMALFGEPSGEQTGSVRRPSTLRWTGGASPMFTSSATRQTIQGFGVENNGTATMFLQLNSGAQANRYEDLTFVVPSGSAPFSDSVIKATSNCLGYSEFSHIYMTSPAPVFLKVDGGGSPNGVTPIFFDHITAKSSGAGLTFLQIIDETIEGVYIRDSHFIQGDGTSQMMLVDTSLTPLASTINVLSLDGVEFDTNASATVSHLFMKLVNVDNCRMVGCVANGNGRNYLATLDNSHVTEFSSNHIASLNEYVFNPSNGSTVNVGDNEINWSNVKGIIPLTDPTFAAGYVKHPYSASMQLRGDELHGKTHGIFQIDVTNGSGYSIALDVVRPGYMTPGQVFTVQVRNVSGAAISAGSFSAAYSTAGAPVAPASGFNRSYTFIFDGTRAIEISRASADVPN